MDSINHILNELFLRSSESSLVRDVIGGVNSLGVLSMDSSDLDVVLVGNSLEFGHVLGELWKSDVDRGSKGSSQVGWAGSDVS